MPPSSIWFTQRKLLMGQISKCVLIGRHKELLVSADVYVSFHSVLFWDVPLRLHITTVKILKVNYLWGALIISGHQVMRYKDVCERGSIVGTIFIDFTVAFTYLHCTPLKVDCYYCSDDTYVLIINGILLNPWFQRSHVPIDIAYKLRRIFGRRFFAARKWREATTGNTSATIAIV